MKYMFQMMLILLLSFLGEILAAVIPLPVPAGIYGMVILFICLCLKIIPLSAVRETGKFLVSTMAVMLIPATVGLMDSWSTLQTMLVPALLAATVLTLLIMGVTGHTVQALIREPGEEEHKDA